MKKRFLLLLLGYLLINCQIYSQVGINTEEPNKLTDLEVTNLINASGDTVPRGVMIPRMTEAQRDQIDVTTESKNANSLMIYNIDEDCYNYYSFMDSEWKSVCGQLGKSAFTFDCSDVIVMGTYIEGQELAGSNYLRIKVNVTKPGSYTLSGTTDNGYGFVTSVTFMAAGEQTIMVPGQGKPVDVQTDEVKMNGNGTDKDCPNAPVLVNVLSAAGTYTFNCSQSKVRGVYRQNVELTADNYIELSVNVSEVGSYEFLTNTVDGISFSASGTFASAGVQTVRLQGTGKPTNTKVKTMTITGNSKDGVATCDIKVIACIKKKKYLSIGGDNVGYTLGPNTLGLADIERSPVWAMFSDPTNFGALEESVFKIESVDASDFIPNAGYGDNEGINVLTADVLRDLLMVQKPDICFLGYYNSAGWTPEKTQVFKDYLEAGGIVIANCQLASAAKSLFDGIFNLPSLISNQRSGYVFTITGNNDDTVINGPFGNVRGKYWGTDAGDLSTLSNVPSDQFYIYSSGPDAQGGDVGISEVSMARHRSLNFFYCGEGAWYAGYYDNTPRNTISPFWIDLNTHKPIDKPNYGYTSTRTVSNSTLMANLLSWALTEAEFNGINKE